MDQVQNDEQRQQKQYNPDSKIRIIGSARDALRTLDDHLPVLGQIQIDSAVCRKM